MSLFKSHRPAEDDRGLSPQIVAAAKDLGVFHQMEETDLLEQYRGQFVAVLKGRVVGSGTDKRELRRRTAEEHGVDPNLLAISYVECEDDY